jgi:hypothetical protein
MLSDTAASASTAAAAAAAPVAERWQAAEARRYLALRSSLAGSILLAVAFLIDLTPFSAPGFGRSQLLAAAAGAAALGLGGALALPVGRRLPAGLLTTVAARAIWPILGSMFMFRLILYMYDT